MACRPKTSAKSLFYQPWSACPTRRRISARHQFAGKVLTLVDLRVKMGLPSAKTELEELIQLLHDGSAITRPG